MKHTINYKILILCIAFSSTMVSQVVNSPRKNLRKKSVAKSVKKNPYGKFVMANAYKLVYNDFKPYKDARIKSTYGGAKVTLKLPKKEINFNNIEYDADWGYKGTSAVYRGGKRGKTSLSFFKNIKKKKIIIFPNDFDHIIVTDTLYAPVTFLNTDGKPRRDNRRSYIKIIANCIVYDGPMSLSSTRLKNKTDYVFSTKEIKFKSAHKGLKQYELSTDPPFVKYDTHNIRVHKDPYKGNEQILSNRLFIEIMKQISTRLNGKEGDDNWKRDKLLIEFQNYRFNKIETNILYKDEKYEHKFNELVNNFDSKYANAVLKKDREFEGIRILVEGEVEKLHKTPFKYYALLSKATLLPVANETTGALDKLGHFYYKATGNSKSSLIIEARLGYNSKKFNEASQILHKKELVLENNPPKTLMKISAQPLKSNGKTIGRIVPISNQILRFEIDLAEENLSLLKLFLKNDNTFNLDYKIVQGQKEGNQEITLEIPKKILKQLDYHNLINEFNVVESNTITDAVKITSNLSSFLGKEKGDVGALNYIEISLEFLFDNQKTVFRGPERMSSHSVLGSEKEIRFIKYSDNYSVKITGTAYYEFGERDVKDDFIITDGGNWITLDESIFDLPKKNKF